MKDFIIYKCVNKVNSKVYIGFTSKPLDERIKQHIIQSNNSKYLFHKALKKYGAHNFEWGILLETYDKDYALNEMESYFINEYNSYYKNGYGYNMTFGGQGGMLNKKHSELTKQKMKDAWEINRDTRSRPKGFPRVAIENSANKRRGKPSWNKGKKMEYENAGKKYKGKTWVVDNITGKRVWVINESD